MLLDDLQKFFEYCNKQYISEDINEIEVLIERFKQLNIADLKQQTSFEFIDDFSPEQNILGLLLVYNESIGNVCYDDKFTKEWAYQVAISLMVWCNNDVLFDKISFMLKPCINKILFYDYYQTTLLGVMLLRGDSAKAKSLLINGANVNSVILNRHKNNQMSILNYAFLIFEDHARLNNKQKTNFDAAVMVLLNAKNNNERFIALIEYIVQKNKDILESIKPKDMKLLGIINMALESNRAEQNLCEDVINHIKIMLTLEILFYKDFIFSDTCKLEVPNIHPMAPENYRDIIEKTLKTGLLLENKKQV